MTDDDGKAGRAELEAALERVVTAARAHLAAVTAADGRSEDDRVWQSYVELNNASFDYDELLLDAYGEVTPWDVDLIEPEEAEGAWEPVDGEPADDHPMTISVRQRRDYAVPSVAALLRVAEASRQQSPHVDDADEPIGSVAEALVELMQSGDGALGSLDVPELEPVRGVVTVSEVARPLDPAELDDEDDDAAFRLAAGDRVLCRVDEQAYDEDALDDDGHGHDGHGHGGARPAE
jgi:hypothetical protein